METLNNLPVMPFNNQQEWRDWLSKYHDESRGVWLKLAKKSSGESSVTYFEALDQALCFGWIDAIMQKYDEKFYLQKFTPRGPKSVWSKVNVAKAEALIKSGRMQSAGFASIEAAKESGAWQAAYDSQRNSIIPQDFQSALDENPKAKQFFETLNKANVYAFCWRIQTAKKPETRKARIEKFIDMLHRGEKLH